MIVAGQKIVWTPRDKAGPKYGPTDDRGGPYRGTLAAWVEVPGGRIGLVYHDLNRALHIAFEDELRPQE